TSSSDKSSKRNSNKRPPTRRLVRHLLRARVEATRQLAAFLRKVDKEGVRVAASGFLVDVYGGGHDSLFTDPPYGAAVVGDETAELYPSGWRHGREVIRYLRDKGAMVNKIMAAEGGDFVEDEWAALSSDGELSSPEGLKQPKEEQELEWVVPGRK
ncbi:12812_t:CDS:1, partial [Acaulospora colombiana]